jgi:phage I-like protein
MFDFPDLTGMDNIAALAARKEAKEYWRMLKHLHELWTGFGDRAERLINVYDWHSKQRKMVEDLSKVLDWGDIKTTNIAAEMDRTDEYLKDIAVKLGEAPLDAVLPPVTEEEEDFIF